MLLLKVIEVLIYLLLLVVAVGMIGLALKICYDLFMKAKERDGSDNKS